MNYQVILDRCKLHKTQIAFLLDKYMFNDYNDGVMKEIIVRMAASAGKKLADLWEDCGYGSRYAFYDAVKKPKLTLLRKVCTLTNSRLIIRLHSGVEIDITEGEQQGSNV